MTEAYDPEAHYDRVTHAWGLLLGEELHYGVFASGEEPLEVATRALTDLMIEAAQPAPGLRFLDVGCGSGTQACRLATDHGVEVLGITTSGVGVATATERARGLGVEGVTFEQRDGTDNGLPDASFDVVWALESSHLMPDRVALVEESARVLRPGGRLVLCDIVRLREIGFLELRERREEFAVLRAGFGAARMDPLAEYARWASEAGLVVEQQTDLSAPTRPTFARWRENLQRHRAEVAQVLEPADVEAFERSLGILDGLWGEGTLGYGLIAARKPVDAAS